LPEGKVLEIFRRDGLAGFYFDRVVFPDCRGPTMATALNWFDSFRSVSSAERLIMMPMYKIGIGFRDCKENIYPPARRLM
jgi:hypothetical protein